MRLSGSTTTLAQKSTASKQQKAGSLSFADVQVFASTGSDTELTSKRR